MGRPMIRMRSSSVAVLCVALLPLLGSCSGAPPGAKAAPGVDTDLQPNGKPYVGPATVTSAPPADNTDARLYCHPEGVGSACSRQPGGQ